MSFDCHGNLTADAKQIVSVHHVAAYVLSLTGEISPWQLQRFVYYSQACKLAFYEYPLFRARVEAWDAGPAIPELYRLHKGKFKVDSWAKGSSNKISKTNKKVIDGVVKDYGALDTFVFAEIARSESPWKDSRRFYPSQRRGKDTIIDQEDILIAYSGLFNSQDLIPIYELAGKQIHEL